MADKTTKFNLAFDIPTEYLTQLATDFGYKAKQPNPHFKNGVSPDSEREIKNPISAVEFAKKVLQGKSIDTCISNIVNPMQAAGDHSPKQLEQIKETLNTAIRKQVFGE